MNWKILNIEPTSDKDRIRQAYAKEVKCWHPEEHPKEFRMLQEAYREALRLADQADPRDEIRFVPEDISQSGVREPQFRQDLQAKPEEPEREQPVFEKEPDCLEPEWKVNGRPAVCAEERRDYIRRTEEFLGQCRELIGNEIYANELGSWEYLFDRESGQKLYGQPRFWYEIAVFIDDIQKVTAWQMDAAVRWYLWQFAGQQIQNAEVLLFLKKALKVRKSDRGSYEQAEADQDRKEDMYALMREHDLDKKKKADQIAKLRDKKETGRGRSTCMGFLFLLAIFVVIRIILACYGKNRQEEQSQPAPPVMDYEQYNEYIKQQQSQIDQQKIDEMLDAMQSIQVTEQEATEN